MLVVSDSLRAEKGVSKHGHTSYAGDARLESCYFIVRDICSLNDLPGFMVL
jgi:hypothetical protein